jgi:hypothetical protein
MIHLVHGVGGAGQDETCDGQDCGDCQRPAQDGAL